VKEYKVPLERHAQDLADGRVVAPGDRVRLSDEDALVPHNAALLAEGALIPVSDKGEEIQNKAERRQARAESQTGGES